MKKFVRFTIMLLLIAAVAVIVLMFKESEDVNVVRTTWIKAPKDVVFDQIVHFANWPNWDPWSRMDSGKMKRTMYGTDGTPGSGYTWVGDKTGSGDMRDSAVSGTQLLYSLNIREPHTGGGWGYLRAEDTAGMTKVTWTLTMHFGKPMNAMLIFMNMDKMLGPDFENGLNNMKTYLESKTPVAPATAFEVTEVDYPGHTFAGLRKTVSNVAMGDMMKLFDDAKTVMMKNAAGKINGTSTGLYFTWDTVKKETDMAAVFPVSDTKPIKDVVTIDIPKSKAVMAVLHGGYGKEMDVHGAIMKHITEKGETRGTVIEEYAIGRNEEPDSNKWVTNIYYLLK